MVRTKCPELNSHKISPQALHHHQKTSILYIYKEKRDITFSSDIIVPLAFNTLFTKCVSEAWEPSDPAPVGTHTTTGACSEKQARALLRLPERIEFLKAE